MRRVPVMPVLAAMLAAGAAHAAPSNQVPIGPRAIAMGGAFSSIADDATAVFWNPAGLARIGHQEITFSHADLFKTGIRDNFASFVLPLSPDQATAVDWYRSGFDDDELAFSENRVDVAWALKLRRNVWVGAGGKFITRGTDLDGTSLRQEKGAGADLGVLVTPIDRVRLGLVAQDAFDTRVKATGGERDMAYPRNLRLGASYTLPRRGTLALDVDDRVHAGLEVTPIDAIALRVGTEHDSRDDGETWTYGLGLKAGLFRVDWARVDAPSLESTDHFALAMEFNFNPAQVRIEKLQARDVYTSLYKSYAREPFGTVQLRNLQDRPITTRMSVFVPELMDAPSEQEVVLRPRAVQQVPLTAVLAERALLQRGDQPVTVQIAATYQSQRVQRREKSSGRAMAYAPGAIEWSAGTEQAAAFVTPRDPAVDGLAREAARLVALDTSNPFGNRNLAFTAALVDALGELGVAYVPDPQNPYQVIAETEHAVDTIHYPYQTLARRSGDCDDTTVLMASLLANVGVATRFVDAPGHIFLLVDTGLHEQSRDALGVDSTMFTIEDDAVWIPLETTAVGKGFAEAWRAGAEEYATWSARGAVGTVDVIEAQTRYEPAQPPGERKPVVLDAAGVSARLAADAKAVGTMRDAYFAARFGSVPRELEASAGALAEVAHATMLGGDLAGAHSLLGDALAKAPQSGSLHNNFAIVLAGLDSLAEAEDHLWTALAMGADEPGVWLNAGMLRWAQGDTTRAIELLAHGVAAAGGTADAFRLLALSAEDSTDRAAGAPVTSAGMRAALRKAAARVPATSAAKPATGARPASVRPVRPPRLRVAATRSAMDEPFERHLYWIE